MANPDVDGYTKTLNHQKVIPKMPKDNNPLKTKTTLKLNYNLSGAPVFIFSLLGGQAIHLLIPVSKATGCDILY